MYTMIIVDDPLVIISPIIHFSVLFNQDFKYVIRQVCMTCSSIACGWTNPSVQTWWLGATTWGARRGGPARQASGACGFINSLLRGEHFFCYSITLMERKDDLLQHVAHHLEARVYDEVYETWNRKKAKVIKVYQP